MTYRVKLTPNAMEQLSSIVEYISLTLCAPETALRWSSRIKQAISGLSKMPKRFKLIDEDPWKTMGVRQLPVQNFLVYFWINEETQIVWVTAVVYQKRDQLSALMEMPLDSEE